jgi:Lar family restriction alleviation protein
MADETLVGLLSCPFCGGEARLDIGKSAFEDAEISCLACGMNGPNFDEKLLREENIPLAVAAWNTRARLNDDPTPGGDRR